MNHQRYSKDYLENKIYRVEIDKIGIKAEPFTKMDLSDYLRVNRFYRNSSGHIYAFNSFSDDKIHDISDELDNANFLNIYSYILPATNARTSPYFANFNLGACNCKSTSVDNIENIKAIVYPNPFFDNLEIQIPDNINKCNITVMNPDGQKIGQERYSIDNFKKSINLSYLKSGLYILELDYGEKIEFTKIIKL